MIQIDLQHEQVQASHVPDVDRLRHASVVMNEVLVSENNPPAQGEVAVLLCDEATSRALNGQWRQRDYATNVLSFPADLDVPAAGVLLLGDLAICTAVVQAESESQKKAYEDHFVHLFVHGLLHLLGFDHATDDEAQVMEALEVRVLAQLNIKDPYEL